MRRVSRAKIALARAAGSASRLSGRGGGTSLPGMMLLRLDRRAIGRMAPDLADGSVVISATNGKTTTAALLASVLEHSGADVVHNHAGANLPTGVATALLDAIHGGRVRGDVGLFEVDEAWVPEVVGQLEPRVLVLMNLFRDQLDRYGETAVLAELWNQLVAELPAATTLVVNADDPQLGHLGNERPGTLRFGIEDTAAAESQLRHAAHAKFCPRCGNELSWSAVQLGHLGDYHCPNCDFRRPEPEIAVERVAVDGMAGSDISVRTPGGAVDLRLPIPGLYNVYNAAAAIAAATAISVPQEAIGAGLTAAQAVFGRVERIETPAGPVSLLLIKNPVGANEVMRTITQAATRFDVWIGLNDQIADGRDVSWIWDADFELLAGRVERVTCAGIRAEEIALRLVHAGVERSAITIEHAVERSFDEAVAAAATAGRPIFALPTYTALLELRAAISQRGDAPDHWRQAA